MSKPPSPIFGWGIVTQLSMAIVVAIVVPLVAGIAVSRLFNLGAIPILAAMLVGVTLGALAVYRIVQNAYEQLGGGK